MPSVLIIPDLAIVVANGLWSEEQSPSAAVDALTPKLADVCKGHTKFVVAAALILGLKALAMSEPEHICHVLLLTYIALLAGLQDAEAPSGSEAVNLTGLVPAGSA